MSSGGNLRHYVSHYDWFISPPPASFTYIRNSEASITELLINKRKVQAVAVQRKEDLLKDFVTDYKINGKKAVKKAERYTTLLLREFKGMMVQRYAHHHTESLRAAIEKIDEIKKPIITILSQSA